MEETENKRIEALLARLDTEVQKLHDERDKTRAAFAYMGERTQKGLTLEALAKGAGILWKNEQHETIKLRASLEQMTQNSSEGWALASKLRTNLEQMTQHANEGWNLAALLRKFQAQDRVRAMENVASAARNMSKHQKEHHELSSCCGDVIPGANAAYALERTIQALDASTPSAPDTHELERAFRTLDTITPAAAPAQPVKSVSVQCCHCKGSGELKSYQIQDGVVDLHASPTGPFKQVLCPTCDGFGVVVATELRAVTQWEKAKNER